MFRNVPKPPLTPGSTSQSEAEHNSLAVIVLANNRQSSDGFLPALARIGTLPVVLRTILAAQEQQANRIVVCVGSSEALFVRNALEETSRLPESIEWYEQESAVELLPSVVREVAATADRVVLLLGTRAYQPALIKSACDWNESSGALALTTGDELVGVYALSQSAALEFANKCNEKISALEGLHRWMESRGSVTTRSVPCESWQDITTPEDRLAAEHKLDNWLVKPTDGIFARMNRRISIPISRQAIKCPISPNMVTLFVLGVSLASAVFFARGGYWAMLLGAVLSVWASILDGCDGEVARLKLQSSAFGCWLDTICDYLYYVLLFAGMALGLARSSGSHVYLAWGTLLLFGAGMSFVVVGTLRHRLSGDHPERLLSVWQEKAEKRSSNPLLYLGRNTEFIIRRCFFPYAILAFALLNITKIAFITTAVGANLVWVIAVYSWFVFSTNRSGSASRTETGIGPCATVELPS